MTRRAGPCRHLAPSAAPPPAIMGIVRNVAKLGYIWPHGCSRVGLIKVLKQNQNQNLHHGNQDLRTRAHLGAVEPVDGCLVCGGHLAIAGVDGDAGLLLDGGEALTTNQRSVFTMI